MQKIRKIVVACDFSEYTPQVIKFAAELAGDINADLILMNS
jgi:chemotaxis regulatin CheY-phosphate phosphatase CheZ